MSKKLSNEEAIIAALRGVGDQMDQLNRKLESVEEFARHEVSALEQTALPRDEYRNRRNKAVGLAIATALIAIALEHYTVTRCFLSPSQAGWSKATCAAIYPGYSAARERNEANLAQLRSLVSSIPENRQRIDQLEQQIEELQK